MTSRRTKRALLYLARALGLFALTRTLTANSVRILCYHGISIGDQHQFEPVLFMRLNNFVRRLAVLQKGRWRVVTLTQALAELARGTVKDAPVVITIDDGWNSTIKDAVPALQRARMPATLYVATHYLTCQYDVFDVTCQYMLWKSRRTNFELRMGVQSLDGVYDLSTDRNAVRLKLLESADRDVDAHGKQYMLTKLAEALVLDFSEITSQNRFLFMSADDGRALLALGIDIQLHSHLHNLPKSNLEDVRIEVERNRKILEAIKNQPCDHFCYPSGDYDLRHPGWLASCGVQSATTCEPGLADKTSNRFLLPRILDRDFWSDVEFEAAISGFIAVCDRIRGAVLGSR